jgi:rhamnosyltransferase
MAFTKVFASGRVPLEGAGHREREVAPQRTDSSRVTALRYLRAWRGDRPEEGFAEQSAISGADPLEDSVRTPRAREHPPRVSIALLTRNGEATLPALLDALWKQKVTTPLEIVAVDSGSTDRTRQILNERVNHVVTIEPGAFNHGLTRNLAIEQATGDLVVFIVQDALPTSDRWLTDLIAPLVADETVAGAFARQLPRPDASSLTRHYLEQWVAYLEQWAAAEGQGWSSEIADAEWHAITPQERFLRCVFDNVCSCVRRSVWAAYPFAETPIGEDIEWARDVLLAGHRIVYAPQATVVHSHERSARYEYRRTYLLHRRLWELFELRTIPTLPLVARAIASSLALHLRCELPRPARWPHAAALAVAWPAGQYLGARSALRGQPLPPWRPGTV